MTSYKPPKHITDNFNPIDYYNKNDKITPEVIDITNKKDGGMCYFRTTDNKLHNDTDFIYNETTKNLGIGVSNPLSKLHVVGNQKVQGDVNIDNKLNFSNVLTDKIRLYQLPGNTTDIYGFGITDGQLNYHTDVTNSAHVFYAGGTNGDGNELLRIRGDNQIYTNSSLNVSGFSRFNNTLIVSGATTLLSDLNVSGNSIIKESLTVSGNSFLFGKIGIGTATPTSEVHIKNIGTQFPTRLRIEKQANLNGNTSFSRFQFSRLREGEDIRVLKGDILGRIEFTTFTGSDAINTTELIMSSIHSEYSGTSTSSERKGDIVFMTNNNSFSEKMRIAANGNVGIGVLTGGSASYQLELSTNSAGKPGNDLWTVVSDQRLKENIELADLNQCYINVKNIPLKRYKWKDDVYTYEQLPDRNVLGWIAQDVEQIFPKAVTKKNMFNIEDCRDLDASQLYKTLWGCTQKLIEKVELLEEKNKLLENEINLLKNNI